MPIVTKLMYLLSALGAMNWGLVAFFEFNLVEELCGMLKVKEAAKITYGVIAIAGLFTLIALFTL